MWFLEEYHNLFVISQQIVSLASLLIMKCLQKIITHREIEMMTNNNWKQTQNKGQKEIMGKNTKLNK